MQGPDAFLNLVGALAASAMQQLGKLVNPLTGKTEVNLEGARVTITLVEMLRKKTKGNLSDDETKVLLNTLSSLQLNYVDEANRSKDSAAPSEQKKT